MCIKPCPKNKPAFFSRSDTVQVIYTMCSTLQPPDYVPMAVGTGHTPRKLPRLCEQSPASSHNTPVLSHTRSFNIPIYRPYVKKKFSISAKIFGIFFVQVYEINFGGNNPLKLPRCSLIRALLHMFFDRLSSRRDVNARRELLA